MELAVERLTAPSPEELALEIVERKGLGHPDTICDALAENLSVALSRYYLKHFGVILHHNVDKALLCGGTARPAFNGGEILQPIEIYLAGRATTRCQGVSIPVDQIAIEASRAWLQENLRYLDVSRDVRIYPRIRSTSSELATLFVGRSRTGAALANDTSFGAGFSPFDAVERAVLVAESALSAPQSKASAPWIGEDIKVMGARCDRALSLTVACALVGRHVRNFADYQEKKTGLAAIVRRAVREAIDTDVQVTCIFRPIVVTLSTTT